ncbi:VP39 [Buzura suppressaria nucleopolyhedrovirus]|uniref:VP39 n=1 Tax=Buzura suppressaria nuclear polyhedrosis virus TaxID=74320 RepID=W5VKH2_NPVBS|nr:VP39 [Buzura suppressaria nucleopolyhedrovirus]AHH82656.1 VP39 [Buzura suppressaria nucleopolyhedrovirus]QYF10627.1 virion capsid protein 39 [Buzura suppressaria nucleopolyhedrovirus]
MSLIPSFGPNYNNRLKSYCIFNSVRPFDTCQNYGSPCSPDNNIDDGTYICQGHLTRFKIEKMVLPIPDSDGNTYNRLIGRSLVLHTEPDNEQRIMIPTRDNYQNVLMIGTLSYAEQLIWHMIYENVPEQERICGLLQASERYQKETYSIAENVYSRTLSILALTNPTRSCSRVRSTSTRVYHTPTNDTAMASNIAMILMRMPNFIRNLIEKLVAPEIMNIDSKSLLLRNCATCYLRDVGLIAEPAFYNPMPSVHINQANDNVLQIDNVLKFRGNANALQRYLNRYDPYPVIVPLFLGQENVITVKTLPPYRQLRLIDENVVTQNVEGTAGSSNV